MQLDLFAYELTIAASHEGLFDRFAVRGSVQASELFL